MRSIAKLPKEELASYVQVPARWVVQSGMTQEEIRAMIQEEDTRPRFKPPWWMKQPHPKAVVWLHASSHVFSLASGSDEARVCQINTAAEAKGTPSKKVLLENLVFSDHFLERFQERAGGEARVMLESARLVSDPPEWLRTSSLHSPYLLESLDGWCVPIWPTYFEREKWVASTFITRHANSTPHSGESLTHILSLLEGKGKVASLTVFTPEVKQVLNDWGKERDGSSLQPKLTLTPPSGHSAREGSGWLVCDDLVITLTMNHEKGFLRHPFITKAATRI